MNTLDSKWILNIWDSERRLLERYLPEGAFFGASQNTEVSGLTGVYIVPGTDMTSFIVHQSLTLQRGSAHIM